jgi:hypothetical protein
MPVPETDQSSEGEQEGKEETDDDYWDGDGTGTPTRRRWPILVVVAILLAGLGLGLGLAFSGSSDAAVGPEGVDLQNVPALASPDTTLSGAPVDGITCRTTLQQSVKYHIHVHLDIFVNGQQMGVPAGVGIPTPRLTEHLTNGVFMDNGVNNCLYWLHVHTNDGVIHVESPYRHTFTLGQFFDIWNQPLGPGQVGPAKGSVVAFVNGQRFNGNPRDVPLLPHAVLQLDVGQPVVPYQAIVFGVKGLCGSGSLSCGTAG